MKKVIIFSLLSLMLASCATSRKINSLRPGMDKNTVLYLMGEPSSSSSDGNVEYLRYLLSATSDDAFYGRKTTYFVKLVNGHVASYGKMGDFGLTKDPTYNYNINTNDRTKTNDDTGKMYQELRQLKELLDEGILTQQEYDVKKKAVLDKYK